MAVERRNSARAERILGYAFLALFLYLVLDGSQDAGDPLTNRDLIQQGSLLVAGLLLIVPRRLERFLGLVVKLPLPWGKRD